MKTELQRRRDRLNNIPIVISGALWFMPMSMFWMPFVPPLRPFTFDIPAPSPLMFFGCLALSLLPIGLPVCYFRPRAFERRKLYPLLGLKLFRRLAPDGDLVNSRLRAIDPGYRRVRTRQALDEHIQGTYSNERAHLVFFLAGLFTTIFAVRVDRWVIAVVLTAGNTAFNLYPVLHQRYKRARLRRARSMIVV